MRSFTAVADDERRYQRSRPRLLQPSAARRALVYDLADQVYLAVHNGRPQAEINRLLDDLRVATHRKES